MHDVKSSNLSPFLTNQIRLNTSLELEILSIKVIKPDLVSLKMGCQVNQLFTRTRERVTGYANKISGYGGMAGL